MTKWSYLGDFIGIRRSNISKRFMLPMNCQAT